MNYDDIFTMYMKATHPYRNWRAEAGEWNDEPDFLGWEHEGVTCYLARQKQIGIWQGYIVVTDNHPWYRKEIEDLQHVDVHGGITYADSKNFFKDVDQWWVGFDACHEDEDLVPGSFDWEGTYKNFGFMKFETQKLANQYNKATERK